MFRLWLERVKTIPESRIQLLFCEFCEYHADRVSFVNSETWPWKPYLGEGPQNIYVLGQGKKRMGITGTMKVRWFTFCFLKCLLHRQAVRMVFLSHTLGRLDFSSSITPYIHFLVVLTKYLWKQGFILFVLWFEGHHNGKHQGLSWY